MAFRKGRERKRADPATEDETDDRDDRPRRSRPTDDLDARLDAVTSRFATPPSAEELRAAFGRKKEAVEPTPPEEAFTQRYPTETLFVPTVDDPVEEFLEAEDRSRTRGDYYYDPDDAWAVLGVRPGAPWKEIAAAHRRLAMQHHPDRLLDQSPEARAESEALMRDVNVAYNVLRRLTGN